MLKFAAKNIGLNTNVDKTKVLTNADKDMDLYPLKIKDCLFESIKKLKLYVDKNGTKIPHRQ